MLTNRVEQAWSISITRYPGPVISPSIQCANGLPAYGSCTYEITIQSTSSDMASGIHQTRVQGEEQAEVILGDCIIFGS
jgi:hypothetical protein